VLSPNKNDQGVFINQDAWFSLGNFSAGKTDTYKIKKNNNGVYLLILDGEIEVNGEILSKKDGIGIWDTDKVTVKVNENASVLLMDVPMNM
jgi:hypothetical protein